MERRDKINYYLDIAEAVTGRGTCLHLSKPFPHHSALLGIRWPLGFIFRLLGPPLASRAELWYFFIE